MKKLLLGCLLGLGLQSVTVAGEVLPEWLSLRNARSGKLLVTANKIPTSVDYELIGSVEVGGRWFENIDGARQRLAVKAREMGANAVVEMVFRKSSILPLPAAASAYGTAVRIPDIWTLERLAGETGSWE